MTLPGDSSYQMYSALCEIGFTAGITLKGPWEDQRNVYSFIGESLVPAGFKIVVPKQVHGAEIKNVDQYGFDREFEADGTISNRPNTCLTVTTADCIPMLMVDPLSGYFSAVHIGWRSFVSGIVENLIAVAKVCGVNLDSSKFMIGPGIGSSCFRVGREVSLLFDKRYITERDGFCYLDLREAIWNKLNSFGVDNSKLGGLSDCTSCMADRYYSYRRDKASPIQMVTFIYKSV